MTTLLQNMSQLEHMFIYQWMQFDYLFSSVQILKTHEKQKVLNFQPHHHLKMATYTGKKIQLLGIFTLFWQFHNKLNS